MGNSHEGNLQLKEELKMPWKKESVVQQRLRFLIEAGGGEESITGVCRRYEISRKTGYKWLKRYERDGTIEVLKDQSRRPQHSRRRTSNARAQRVLAVRDEKGWGADKISEVLASAGILIPSLTVHRILKRHGRIKREASAQLATKRFARGSCNELAQMDFKGEYELPGGGKCYPLTFLDDCSRYLLGLWPLWSTAAAPVKQVLESHFRAHGVPVEMLMDHGSTWYCNHNQHGLTWLSIWLLKQGSEADIPTVIKLINLLRTNYGQYWLKELDKWDSRSRSLGSYCAGLGVRWSHDGGKTWSDFLPNERVSTSSATVSMARDEDFQRELVTKDDWLGLSTVINSSYQPSLAASLVIRAYQLLDQGHLRQAFIEGVTALEVALDDYVRQKRGTSPIVDGYVKQFQSLSLSVKVATVAVISGTTPTSDVEDTVAAYKVRNDVVHEGAHPSITDEPKLSALLRTAAALIPGPKFRFPRSHTQNALGPPE